MCSKNFIIIIVITITIIIVIIIIIIIIINELSEDSSDSSRIVHDSSRTIRRRNNLNINDIDMEIDKGQARMQ